MTEQILCEVVASFFFFFLPDRIMGMDIVSDW